MPTTAARMKKFFGTDGIRGVASVPPLDPETMVRLGKAIARIFLGKGRKHRILIGKDTRLSGYMLETALASGITSMGADVLLVGPVPTPGVAYLTRSMRADAGVVISASHNPYEDNGIKIFASDGYKLPDERELQIESLIEPEALDGQSAAPSEIGKATRINDAIGRYTVFLKGCFPRELTLEGLKIGIDCANGATYTVAPQTLGELGADVVSRGVSPNGRNINAGFGSLYPEIMRKLVLEYSLNVGVSFDGDGDRAVFSDEKGNLVDGDMVLAVCARDLLARDALPGRKLVLTVMSNLGIVRHLENLGIEVIQAPVGDRYVLEEMLRSGAALGGEQSGHTIFHNHTTTGDGILTALMLFAVMNRQGKLLSELCADLVRYPQKLMSIDVATKPPLDSLEPVVRIVEKIEKELGSKGRVLVRYSGTESKVRVLVECENEDNCRRYAQEIADVIKGELGTL